MTSSFTGPPPHDLTHRNFGDRLRFDASGIPGGTLDYRVLTTEPGTPERMVIPPPVSGFWK